MWSRWHPFSVWKKRSSLGEIELLSVDSGLCCEMTQSEQGAFHRGTPRPTHWSLSEFFEPRKIPLSTLLLKTHLSLWQLYLPFHSLSCFSVERRTRRHELPLVFNLFNYTHGLCGLFCLFVCFVFSSFFTKGRAIISFYSDFK